MTLAVVTNMEVRAVSTATIADPKTPTRPRLMTYREAAQALAVSERTLWSLVRDGKIRVIRIAKSVRRIASEDLEAFIASAGSTN